MRYIVNSIRLRFADQDPNVVKVVTEGTLWAFVIQLTNPFYQLFVRQMGGGDLAISLVSAMPALLALLTLLPLSAYIDTVPRKKDLVAKSILIYACILPVAAMTPYMGAFKVPMFILMISLFNVPLLAYTVGWQSFFSDIFHPRHRVMPYANREMMRNLVQATSMLAGGYVLSYMCQTAGQKILAYQILFMAAFGFALLQCRVLKSTDDSHVAPKPAPRMRMIDTYKQCVVELKKNKSFSLFLLLLLFYYIAWQMAWPLFFIYLVEFAGANEFVKGLFDMATVGMFVVTSNFWGRYIQRKGSQRASVIGLYSAATLPLWLVFCHSKFAIAINYLFGGAFSGAMQMGLFQDMMEQLPEENKTLNIGIYNTVTQLSAFVAPIIGVAIYRATSMEFTMALSTVLRGTGATLFLLRYLHYRKKAKV